MLFAMQASGQALGRHFFDLTNGAVEPFIHKRTTHTWNRVDNFQQSNFFSCFSAQRITLCLFRFLSVYWLFKHLPLPQHLCRLTVSTLISRSAAFWQEPSDAALKLSPRFPPLLGRSPPSPGDRSDTCGHDAAGASVWRADSKMGKICPALCAMCVYQAVSPPGLTAPVPHGA